MDITYYKKHEPFFGSWHIANMLGEGSFGKVFEIHREDFGETYKAALKVVTVPQNESEVRSVMQSGMDNANVTEYFESVVKDIVSEVVLMSKLKGNSHVVSYEDHQVIPHADKRIGWNILIRMELLTPLLDYAQNAELTRKDIMKLGIDVCHALELCQKYNIIHRDIKPENIFVSESGNFKLGDFGIARTIEKTSSGLSKKGTYTYMAPEVYKGEEYGSSVDIYSLGIVLYRLLNNNRTLFLPPYPEKIKHSDLDNALVRRISGEIPPAPAGADGRLAEIVLKACAHNPKDRYASPMQMRGELEAILYETDKAKEIYPQGDDVAVEPNEYETSEEEFESDCTFEEEGTVSVFGDAAPRQAPRSPKTPTKFCAKCGATVWYDARLCVECGAQTGQEVRFSGAESKPAGSAIPLSLFPNEGVIVQGLGEMYNPIEYGGHITFKEVYGYISLTNQRIIWSEMSLDENMRPIARVSDEDVSISISDIDRITPMCIDSGVPDLYYWAFQLGAGETGQYGFCFDDGYDAALFEKRNTIIDYLLQTHNIALFVPLETAIPISLEEHEYIVAQCETSDGCFTLTNRRIIWVKTNFSMTQRKPFIYKGKAFHDISIPLDDIESMVDKQGLLSRRITLESARNVITGDSRPYVFDLCGKGLKEAGLVVVHYMQQFLQSKKNRGKSS